MSSDPDTVDSRTDADHPYDFETERYADHPAIDLDSVLVRYEDRPDQRTVYPSGLSSVERMTTWLTADDGVFVDLEDAR